MALLLCLAAGIGYQLGLICMFAHLQGEERGGERNIYVRETSIGCLLYVP